MQTDNHKTQGVAPVGSSAVLGVWVEKSISFFYALLFTIRIIFPERPGWVRAMPILHDSTVCCLDDFGDGQMHGVHPLHIFRKNGIRLLMLRFRMPLLKRAWALRQLVPMYRWVKNNRAAHSIGKRHLEFVCAHTPNEKS